MQVLQVNEIPPVDPRDTATGCCPRFHPEAWQGVTLRLVDKPFVRASTHSVLHVPLDMGRVMTRTLARIEAAHAAGSGHLVLSHDTSPWRAEHLFAVERDVPGAEMVRLSGEFLCEVFAGPYAQMPTWIAAMKALVAARGRTLADLYFYYPTCPRCAKAYGVNHVVGLARLGPATAAAA